MESFFEKSEKPMSERKEEELPQVKNLLSPSKYIEHPRVTKHELKLMGFNKKKFATRYDKRYSTHVKARRTEQRPPKPVQTESPDNTFNDNRWPHVNDGLSSELKLPSYEPYLRPRIRSKDKKMMTNVRQSLAKSTGRNDKFGFKSPYNRHLRRSII